MWAGRDLYLLAQQLSVPGDAGFVLQSFCAAVMQTPRRHSTDTKTSQKLPVQLTNKNPKSSKAKVGEGKQKNKLKQQDF